MSDLPSLVGQILQVFVLDHSAKRDGQILRTGPSIQNSEVPITVLQMATQNLNWRCANFQSHFLSFNLKQLLGAILGKGTF